MHGQCRTFSNPVISDISRHLQTGRDSMLTACTLHLFIPSTVYFDSPNQFHVHTYISCWRSEEQSPSPEINFNSRTSCTQHPTHLASISTHSIKQVETGEPTQMLSLLPSPHSSAHMCTDLAAP